MAAGIATALPTRAAVIVEAMPLRTDPPTAIVADPTAHSLLPAGWTWTTHTVDSPHESLASIARTIDDDPRCLASSGTPTETATWATATRFTDPAVVKLGWTLRVPAPAAPRSLPVAAPPGATPTSRLRPHRDASVEPAVDPAPLSHIVITDNGDTLWDEIDEVVDTPTMADVRAVAERSNGATTPLGPWVFDADNPDLIHTGDALRPPTGNRSSRRRAVDQAAETAPIVTPEPEPAAVAPADDCGVSRRRLTLPAPATVAHASHRRDADRRTE